MEKLNFNNKFHRESKSGNKEISMNERVKRSIQRYSKMIPTSKVKIIGEINNREAIFALQKLNDNSNPEVAALLKLFLLV